MAASSDVFDVSPDLVSLALSAAGNVLFEFRPDLGTLCFADPVAAHSVLHLETDDSAGTEAAVTVDSFNQLIDERFVVERQATIDQALANERTYSIEYLFGPKGDVRWIEERGTWMNIGGAARLVGLIRPIDDQKRREARLSYLASYDELTGQLNRARCKELLNEAVEGVRAGTRTGTLLLIGIDGIGKINSDFGFDAADQVIVEVASRIQTCLGKDGTLGRVAGTKFAVILNDDDGETMRRVCRDVMNSMREEIVMTRAGGIAVSVCIGATILSQLTATSAEALAQSEAAFDQARRQGPSSFQLFNEGTETVARRHQNSKMVDTILTALNEQRVYLAYQPIVRDHYSPCTKYECLIRMRAHDGSEIPAPSFVPVAEELGLVHLLDRRVLELATDVLHEVPHIELNVNLSWETVKDPVWAEGYLSHLRSQQAVSNRLTIELTETQAVDALDASREFVSVLKELGCKFAMDDFGAGYTSFRNLKGLDIDVLKIDGSFVSGLSASRENQLFVRTLLDLARNFGMKTVAEWVDNENDATLLKALGVDYLQGFFIGKPTPNPDWGTDAGSAVA